MVCAVKGYRFTPVSSDAFAREKLETMRALGGAPILVPSESGKTTPELFDEMKAELSRQRAQPGVFWADQFHNGDGIAGYRLRGRSSGRMRLWWRSRATAA
jgi:cysteine synthase A